MDKSVEEKRTVDDIANALSTAADVLDYPDDDTIKEYKNLMDMAKKFFSEKIIGIKEYSLSGLESEYIRLFVTDIGGLNAPPYASFYTNKRLMGNTTKEFLDFSKLCGYELNDNIIKGPPDHASLEIGFLSRLLEEGQIDLACVMIRKHLSWFEQFMDMVSKNASLEFYYVVTKTTLNFINFAREVLCHKILTPSRNLS